MSLITQVAQVMLGKVHNTFRSRNELNTFLNSHFLQQLGVTGRYNSTVIRTLLSELTRVLSNELVTSASGN